MTQFVEESVADALERSLGDATHLRARHAAAVAAARALARKIDEWDTIVRWAVEDAEESGGRPKVPAHDNVSLSTLMKYLVQLGLVPDEQQAAPGARAGASDAPRSELDAFRNRKKRGAAAG